MQLGAVRLKHWAQHYFGTLYGEIYRRHLMPAAPAKAEAEFAAELLGLRGRRVLDLACGYGRHARHLARANEVVGLDISREYLAEAGRGMRGASARRLLLLRADMRALPLVTASMDAVLLLFNSFGYFGAEMSDRADAAEAPRQQVWKLPHVFYERQLVSNDFGQFAGKPRDEASSATTAVRDIDENRGVLQEIERVLRPRGQFLMELPNPKPLLAAVAKEPRRHVVTAHYEIEEQYEWDATRSVLHNRTRFRSKGRKEEGEYHLRLYSLAEMKTLLTTTGFKVLRSFGSYGGDTYSATKSPLLLLHARKQ